jgi:hypothetical protein
MLTDEEILVSLEKLRTDVEDMRAIVETNVARIPLIPARRAPYARLLQDLGRRLVQAHADWLDEVQRELGSAPGRSDRSER